MGTRAGGAGVAFNTPVGETGDTGRAGAGGDMVSLMGSSDVGLMKVCLLGGGGGPGGGEKRPLGVRCGKGGGPAGE
jgi:hypothetical protein